MPSGGSRETTDDDEPSRNGPEGEEVRPRRSARRSTAASTAASATKRPPRKRSPPPPARDDDVSVQSQTSVSRKRARMTPPPIQHPSNVPVALDVASQQPSSTVAAATTAEPAAEARQVTHEEEPPREEKEEEKEAVEDEQADEQAMDQKEPPKNGGTSMEEDASEAMDIDANEAKMGDDTTTPISKALAEQQAVIMNGVHPTPAADAAAAAAVASNIEPVAPNIEPSATQAKPLEVKRLKMPSQHTPGKLRFRETEILHRQEEEEEPPYAGPPTIGVPPQQQLQQPPPIIPRPPDNGSDRQTDDGAEEEEESEEDDEQPPPPPPPLPEPVEPTRWTGLSDRLANLNLFSPERVERPPGEEEEDHDEYDNRNETPPAPKGGLLRSVFFWFFLSFLLQGAFVGYWINPILHNVVQGSKALTLLYKDFMGVPVPEGPLETAMVEKESGETEKEGSTDRPVETTTDASDTLPTSSLNYTLIKEKQQIQKENERIVKENAKTAHENRKRQKLNQDRQEQIRRVTELNERKERENEQVRTETTSLSNSIEALERQKSSSEEQLDRVAINVQELLQQFETQLEPATLDVREQLEQFDKRKQELEAVTPPVTATTTTIATDTEDQEEKHEAERKLDSFSAELKIHVGEMQELLRLFQVMAEKGELGQQQEAVEEARKLMGDSEELFLDLFGNVWWKPSTAGSCPAPEPLDAFVATLEDALDALEVEDEDEEEYGDEGDEEEEEEDEDGGDESLSLENALTFNRVQELLKEFQAEIDRNMQGSLYDEDLVVQIKKLVYKEAEEFSVADLVANAPKPTLPQTDGPPLEEVQKLVVERLEVEDADQTGKVDYAALRNGASILEDATSPSFVDTLPVLNRLAALLSVQSYGFGPEAALTPTWPRNALGQCWAFDKNHNSAVAKERSGEVAVLTVRLARPIFVESVTIEHPPQEISDKIDSAIKQFKVIGYEDASASGHRWHLGGFTYDLLNKGQPSRQEFTIPRKLLGQQVPMLRSITLAIDSNWGNSVSCLYRLRVHGTELKATA